MASTTLYPNSDGTKTGWTNEASGTSNLYASIDEGTASPSDADYNQTAGNNVIAYLLTDTPSDFVTATAVTIKVRLQKLVFKSNDLQFSTCALYKSDESTAITATCDLTGTTGTITTYTFTPTITGATDKTSWDGARLKFNAPTGTTGSVFIYAVQVEVTYSTAAAGKLHHTARLDGLGGVGQKNFNPLLRNRVWSPPQKAIYVPAFSLAN